jgi:hypothetical protein
VDARIEASASATGSKTEEEGGRKSDEETDAQSIFVRELWGDEVFDSPTAGDRVDDANAEASDRSSDPNGGTGATGTSEADGASQDTEGGTVRVAAAIGASVLTPDVTATIADGVTIDASGEVEVKALSDADATTIATGLSYAGDASTSVGAAVAVNVGVLTTEATIGAATVTAGSVAVEAGNSANESNDFRLLALAGGGSTQSDSGSTAVAGAAGVNVVTSDVTAAIADHATVTASTGDVEITARSDIGIQNITGGGALTTGSSGTSVGVAIGVNVVVADTEASIGAGAEVDATSGTVSVVADASISPTKIDFADLVSGIADLGDKADEVLDWATDRDARVTTLVAGAGVAGGGTGIAGSVAVNVFTPTARAYIGPGADVDAADVVVRALDDTRVLDFVGSIGVGLSDGGFGASLDVLVLDKTTEAYVAASNDAQNPTVVQASGNVTVEAVATENLFTISLNFGIGSSTSVAGGAVVFVVVSDTRAFIGDDPDDQVAPAGIAQVTAGGNIYVAADSATMIDVSAGNVAVSTSGSSIGISVTVVVDVDTTEAFIGAGSSVSAAGGGTAIQVRDGDYDGDGNQGTESVTGLALTATSHEDVLSIAVGAGGGSDVGIGGSVTVNILDETTRAHIGDGASVLNTEDALVRASDDTRVLAVAGGAQFGGSGGIGAGVDVGVITKNTGAYVGSNANINVDGDLTLDAKSDESVVSVTANIAASGGFAVTFSACVYVMTTDTLAYVGDGADVAAGGNVAVKADDTAKFKLVAGGLAVGGGSAGVGASNTTLVKTDTVAAYVGDADVRADDGLMVQATSGEDVLAVAAGGGVGSSAGLAGSVVVNDLTETTRAYIADGAQINAADVGNSGQDVEVRATDDTEVLSIAGGVAAGGTAGVGIGAAVEVLTKTTEAYIGGATVNAKRNVVVEAQSSEEYTAIAVSLGAGGAAGVAGSAGVSVLNIETSAFVGDDPNGTRTGGIAQVHADGSVKISAVGTRSST